MAKLARDPTFSPCGRWDSPDLAHSLLWYTPSKQQGNGQPSIRYAARGMKGYRAPSWSWASLDAKIVWRWPAQHGQLLLHVEETRVQDPSNTFSGAANDTEMCVSGNLIPVQLQIMHDKENGSPDEDGSYAVVPRHTTSLEGNAFDIISDALSGSMPTVFLDEALAPSRAIDVHLLPVVTEWEGRLGHPAAEIAGLVVRQHRLDTRDVYERIGVFCFDKTSKDGDAGGSDRTVLRGVFAQVGTDKLALI